MGGGRWKPLISRFAPNAPGESLPLRALDAEEGRGCRVTGYMHAMRGFKVGEGMRLPPLLPCSVLVEAWGCMCLEAAVSVPDGSGLELCRIVRPLLFA